MKRIIAMMLALVLALSLCGCDSSDYKKAMEAFDSGDYATAREIFVELGDYEDSADMVIQCDYQQALAYLDEGEYAQARELFLELGDYEDCKENAMTAAQYMLMEYVEENGEFKKVNPDNYDGIVIQVDNDMVIVAYMYKMTGIINVDLRIGTGIKPGSNDFLIVGTDKTSSHAAYYNAEATLAIKLGAYTQGDKLTWEEFEVNGTNAQGSAYTQDATMLNIFLTSGVKNMTAYLEEVLEQSGLGLTMEDIGFTGYNN